MAEEKRFVDSELFCKFAESEPTIWKQLDDTKIVHKKLGEGEVVDIDLREDSIHPPQIFVQFVGTDKAISLSTKQEYFPKFISLVEIDSDLEKRLKLWKTRKDQEEFEMERAEKERQEEEQRRKEEIEKERERRRLLAAELERQQREIRNFSLYYYVAGSGTQFLRGRAGILFHTLYYYSTEIGRAISSTLKNEICLWSRERLERARDLITNILIKDLPLIQTVLGLDKFTVVTVPRSKKEDYYHDDQKLFRAAVQNAITELSGIEDGTKYIIRTKNTYTTHKRNPTDTDPKPYPGILKDTCIIADAVRNKDILLIDDVYTRRTYKPSPNIDEDAIQALRDKGARSVVLYAIMGAIPPPHHKLRDISEREFYELFRKRA